MGKALVRVALSPISAAVGLIDKKAGAFVFSAIATAASFIPGVGPLISAGMHAANAVTGAYKIGPGRAGPGRAGLSDLGRLSLTQVAAGPRKAVFGRTAMAVDLRYTEPSGADQRYVDAILHLASHKCHSVDKLYINDELAWTLAGGAQGIYAGYLTFQPILQSGPAAYHTVNSGAKWGAAQRMTGCCTAKLRIDRKDKSKDDRSPFAAGLPSNIRVEGCGMAVYDPRRDSTVPGGMGAHRAHDPATWQYQDGATILGENHALQALSWLLGWHIGGWASVGLGLPADTLDMLTFASSANACDEAIALAAGGTQPRYWGGGLINDSDDLGMVMDQFAAACNGWWDDSGGKLGLHVSVNDLAGALISLTDDDLLGGLEWEPFPSIGEQYNVVRGKNPDPEPTALYQPTDYPEARLDSVDSIDRVLPLDLGLVQDKRRAQRIAKQVLQRQQYRGLLTIRVGVRGWLLYRGQPVRVSLRTMGWTDKLFRVERWTAGLDGSVDLTLREENAAIYAWDRSETAAVQPAEPVVYDPRNAPGGQDGAPGAPGAPGEDGLSAFAAVPSLPTWAVICDAAGTPLAGAFDGANGTLQCRYHGADVTAACVFSVVSLEAAGGYINAAGQYFITSITADVAKMTLRAVYAPPGGLPSEQFDLTIPIVKSRRGAAAIAAVDDDIEMPDMTDTVVSDTLVMLAGPGGSIAISGWMGFSGYGAWGGDFVVYLKAQWRLSGGGGPWVDVAPYVFGTPSYYDEDDMVWFGGMTTFEQSVAGPPSQEIREYRMIGRAGGGPIAPGSVSGVFSVSRDG